MSDGRFVEGGRGGYCFEQNLLFGYVLRALGFKLRETTARVRWSVPPGVTTPRVHALLIVEAEGEEYLVDVGFGGNVSTAPLLLKSRDEQQTPHEPFRLVQEDHLGLMEERTCQRQPLLHTPGKRPDSFLTTFPQANLVEQVTNPISK